MHVDGERAGDKGMLPLEDSNRLRFRVGQLEHSSGYWWGLNGGLDELQLHDAALSDAQIMQASQKHAAGLLILPKTGRELEDSLVDTKWMHCKDAALRSGVGEFPLKPENHANMAWTNVQDYRWEAGGPRSIEILNGSR